MDKLQELLDERFPLTNDMPRRSKEKTEVARRIFAEGYNVAMQQVRDFAERHWLMSTVSFIDKTLNNGQS